MVGVVDLLDIFAASCFPLCIGSGAYCFMGTGSDTSTTLLGYCSKRAK